MKIGILTFHRAHNYGAVLQAYAMKVVFSRYGKAELIDYWPDYHNGNYNLVDFRFLSKGISFQRRLVLFRSCVKRLILLPLRLTRYKKFRIFIESNFLKESESIAKIDSQLPQDYDVYVYGSDQIWRVYDMNNYPCPDLVYLGSGVPAKKKKIAYAASMGDVNAETLADPMVCDLLADFASLGVRERDLEHELSKISSLSAKQVLDPTLLVSREEWSNLADTVPQHCNEPYVLFYSLIESSESRRVANKLSIDLGLKLIEINGFETIKGVMSKGLVQTAGPIDFLRLIRDAKFIVSTSFHGVVFSILFQKPFYVCGMKGHAGRVTSLLELLGLSSRMLEDESLVNPVGEIDYLRVEAALAGLIEESNSFVSESLDSQY